MTTRTTSAQHGTTNEPTQVAPTGAAGLGRTGRRTLSGAVAAGSLPVAVLAGAFFPTAATVLVVVAVLAALAVVGVRSSTDTPPPDERTTSRGSDGSAGRDGSAALAD